MFLNVGGAVLGVAVLTVISDSVTSTHGGKNTPGDNVEGYRAGYYAAIAMIGVGLLLSIFFAQKEGNKAQEQHGQQEGEQKEKEKENKGDEKTNERGKESPIQPGIATSRTVSGENEGVAQEPGTINLVEEDGAFSSSIESDK